jgi:uncharacterized protein
VAESVGSLGEVDPSCWNRLGGASSLYLSHEWLSFVERERSADAAYHLVWTGGRLVGALPTYAVGVEDNLDYRVDRLVGADGGRFLVAGTRRGYVNRLMVDAPPEQAGDVLALLLDLASERADDLGLDGLAFLYLDTLGADALASTRPDLVPLLIDTEAVIPLPGRTFEDYLHSIGSRRARMVRREERDFRAAGYDVTSGRLSECWYEAGPLISQVQRKYGHDDSPRLCRWGLRSQADALDDLTVALCARRDGRLVAVSLFYAWRDVLYARAVGFDYAALQDAGEYFTMAFYEPIRHCYRHGYRRLHHGLGLFAKVGRGAGLDPLWAVVPRGHGAATAWRAWNRHAAARCAERCRVDGLAVPPGWV